MHPHTAWQHVACMPCWTADGAHCALSTCAAFTPCHHTKLLLPKVCLLDAPMLHSTTTPFAHALCRIYAYPCSCTKSYSAVLGSMHAALRPRSMNHTMLDSHHTSTPYVAGFPPAHRASTMRTAAACSQHVPHAYYSWIRHEGQVQGTSTGPIADMRTVLDMHAYSRYGFFLQMPQLVALGSQALMNP